MNSKFHKSLSFGHKNLFKTEVPTFTSGHFQYRKQKGKWTVELYFPPQFQTNSKFHSFPTPNHTGMLFLT